jgi:uncharacterized protein (UPF0333 family)
MKKNILILIMATAGLYSCGQSGKSTPETVDKETINSVRKYEYADSIGKRIIIENGFPKGGMKYIDSNGDSYNYIVFWTRIINKTDNTLELKLNVPVDSYEVSSLPGKYYKILIPTDTMTPEKIPLLNYGLTGLKAFLDNNIHKSSSLKRTINPKESSGFYVLMLCLTEGAGGFLRTGLILNGQYLFYRFSQFTPTPPTLSLVNEKEIRFGSINLKNLILQK